MKNLLFTLTITLFLSNPLYGMIKPLESYCQTLFTQAKESAAKKDFTKATINLQWIVLNGYNITSRSKALLCLGGISVTQQKYKEAKFYFKCSADLKDAHRTNNQAEISALALIELGQIASLEDKSLKAIAYFEQARLLSPNENTQNKAIDASGQEKTIGYAAQDLLALKRDRSAHLLNLPNNKQASKKRLKTAESTDEIKQ